MERHAVFVCLVAIAAALPRGEKFRTDYEYSKKNNAFYKLHIETLRFNDAKEVCEAEGAHLMVPASNEDIAQVHGMLKRFPDIGNFVYVGYDGLKHESAEEPAIIDLTPTDTQRIETAESGMRCDVLTRKGEIDATNCWRLHPFVCKVDESDAYYDGQCGVYGTGYTYASTAGSCYKVPRLAYTWNAAYAECQAEGAHLAVLNSEAEHQAMTEFLRTAPRLDKARTSYFYLVGIRAQRPTDGSARVFHTIYNETLEQAGYSGWADGEPNNSGDVEDCGSVFITGKYNDVDCRDKYAFICEKEIHT